MRVKMTAGYGTFNGGMRDKNISMRTEFALFEKWYSK